MKLSRRTKFKLLSVFLAVVLSLVACEIFLRLINYHPAIVDPTLYVVNNSDILPFKLKPNYQGYYLGQEVKTDGDGWRVVSPARAVAANKDARDVVLVLGDSVTFGYGLRNEETVASQLQNLLDQQNRNYLVKNIAAPGYTSWNEYGEFEDYLKKYSAKSVMLIYVSNDVTFDNDYFRIRQGKEVAFSDTAFHRFTQSLYSHFYTAYLISDTVKKLGAKLRGDARVTAANPLEEQYNQAAIDYSMEALVKIRDLCAARGIKFSVGIYRDTMAYAQSPERSLSYEATIKANLERRGIRSFLIKSHVENLSPSDARVFWNDPHPSARAVALMVTDMAKELERE